MRKKLINKENREVINDFIKGRSELKKERKKAN